jgi:hypothetical protein
MQHPFCILKPIADLDSSWFLGLKWATLKDFVFGRDIAFTYGPLYFLSSAPLNIGHYPSLLLEEIVFCIVRFTIIYLIVSQFADLLYKKSWKNYSTIDGILIILGLSLFAFLPLNLPETILALNCLLFIRLIFEIESSKANRKKYLSNILLNMAILAIVCLIKFSYVIVASVIILIALFGLIYTKKVKFIVYILSSFIAFYLVFWALCGQPLSAIRYYFIYGIEISSGYTEVMMITDDMYYEINYGLFGFFVLLFIGISSFFFFIKKDFYYALILFFTLPLLFMAFKEGFVRADSVHFLRYFFQLFPVLLFLILFLVDKPSLPCRRIGQLFVMGSLSVTTVVLINHYTYGFHNPEKYPLMRLLSPDNEKINEYKEAIRNSYPPLSQDFLQQAKNKTVDIFPWNIALLYAYDLNWSPRPVIQSYSAYTPVLDKKNASHFEKDVAPDNIVYNYSSIDNHYPLFDEPIVFRTLLKNYEVQSLDDYLILQRRSEKIDFDYVPINNGVCPIGTLIEVPQYPGQHIYCNIDISTNFFGKLINLLYKSTFMYIDFYIKGQSEPITHKFLRKLGVDGLFVSKYVVDLSDICSIFEGNYVQDIEKIKIRINNNFSYKSDMKYEFYITPIEKK